jgi:hypothetical protein
VEIVILPKEMTKKSYEDVQGKISEEAKMAEESRTVGEENKSEEAVK